MVIKNLGELDTWDEVEGQLRVFLSDWVMHS